MTNVTVQEALKATVEALKGYRRELNDSQPCDAEKLGEAALSEIEASEKCEPVGEVSIDYQGFMAYRRLKDLPEGYHKVYTSPQPREGLVSVPIEPTDEMLRKALAVEFPGTYKTHLRNPANGPKTTKDNEAQILRVTKQYAAFIQAAPTDTE